MYANYVLRSCYLAAKNLAVILQARNIYSSTIEVCLNMLKVTSRPSYCAMVRKNLD